MTSNSNDPHSGTNPGYALGYPGQQNRPHSQYPQPPPQQQQQQPFHPQQVFHPQGMQIRQDNPHYSQQHQQQQQQHSYEGYDHVQQGSLGRYASPGHQGPPVQPGAGQAPVDHGSSSASVSESSPPRSESGSNLRFKISLEAQTAAMQRQDETPVTYLNKGQFYAVALKDTEEYDGDVTSVIRVTFHDASHRRLAARYWSFWLSQQANPKTARALDIEKASSIGMMEIQSKTFDRISFKWNGKTGAKLMVRFNCLSTDFSRIKGVKGIPLRVHMDTYLNGNGSTTTTSATANQDEPQPPMERSFAKIKLFRDKGAERKNKDDHKHLEKMWDKMRGKNADTNPLVSMLAPVQTVSVFYECLDHPEGSDDEDTQDLSETLALQDQETDAGGVVSTISNNNSNSSNSNHNSSLFIDRDPNYVPQHTNKRRPVLCLYIKIGGESVYRAVYLEKFTLTDLVQKLSEKLEIQASTISGVYRKTVKKELLVKMDDAMVGHMVDEMDMVVDYDFNQLDGSVNLTLKY
ncbi:hypothetical protein KVV02_006405 [Mortierella alpina]|uniref:Grh/CP2 DB domain-containing protein n=1 Tax=Mortierella alpina TaxID=64518 RepID=A0A9P8D369_MORAP|nr:hypothetical protein KVV02_006405 [Mortierella alpina]